MWPATKNDLNTPAIPKLLKRLSVVRCFDPLFIYIYFLMMCFPYVSHLNRQQIVFKRIRWSAVGQPLSGTMVTAVQDPPLPTSLRDARPWYLEQDADTPNCSAGAKVEPLK